MAQILFYNYYYQIKLNDKSRPENKEELFNLRHSSARNAIERIFGVLKHRFRILLLAPEYNLEIQGRIPAALACIHNFISIHNPCDKPISSTTSDTSVRVYDDVDDDFMLAGDEPDDTDLRQDMIAQKMWDDYVLLRAQREIDGDADFESELGEDGDEDENHEIENEDHEDD
jgi:hypothetical protein